MAEGKESDNLEALCKLVEESGHGAWLNGGLAQEGQPWQGVSDGRSFCVDHVGMNEFLKFQLEQLFEKS